MHHSNPPMAVDSRPRVPAMPDYMTHEEFKGEKLASYEPKRGPFDFDMKSVWQREAEDKENKEKKECKNNSHQENEIQVEESPSSSKEEENEIQVEESPSSSKEEIKLPAIAPRYPHRIPQPIASKQFHGENRLYFPMPAHKKNEDVNFSKLMGSGYGNEWLQQHDDWEKKNPQAKDSLLSNSETSQPESTQTDNE